MTGSSARIIRRVLALLAFVCAPAGALQIQILASGLNQPIFVASPPGDARLFIVERGGVIRVLKNGSVLPTAFLDISEKVDTAGERGLLGLAFDPAFAANGRFYVDYIDKATFNTVVATYRAPTAQSDVADPATGEIVITIAQPEGFTNHKAGWIGFRPGEPANLYIATGDGGSANDPGNRAQNLSDNLGKILRLDVSVDRFPQDPQRYGYAIPAGNPFAAGGGNPEIYAYGLRNPFRNSFDRETARFYIADVGQNVREEIDIGAAGANYGWRKFEGTRPNVPLDPALAAHTLPIHEYDHNGSGASVTGGYVYRGSRVAGLQGTYFFADFVTNQLMCFRYDGSAVRDLTDWSAALLSANGISGSIASFGEDASGELYVVSLNGQVGRIVGPFRANGDFQNDLKSDILWRNATSGQNAIWRMDALTVDATALIPSVPDANWRIVGKGDINGDGKADVVWRNVSTGDNAIWLMDGFTLGMSALLPRVPATTWTIVGLGDFDADGRADLLWRESSTGQNAVWRMDGLQVIDTALVAAVPDKAWSIAGTGDFDGDGKADILWRNASGGDVSVWLMDGFTAKASAIVQAVPVAWAIAAIADYDGDGKADILWRNASTGENAIWLMNGVTLASSALINGVPDANWRIVAAGDYDGDGKADILWRHGATGENGIWLIDGFSMKSSALIPSVPDVNWIPVGP